MVIADESTDLPRLDVAATCTVKRPSIAWPFAPSPSHVTCCRPASRAAGTARAPRTTRPAWSRTVTVTRAERAS